MCGKNVSQRSFSTGKCCVEKPNMLRSWSTRSSHTPMKGFSGLGDSPTSLALQLIQALEDDLRNQKGARGIMARLK